MGQNTQKHFSASAYGLGLKNLFFGSLFCTFVESEENKIFLRVLSTIIKTKCDFWTHLQGELSIIKIELLRSGYYSKMSFFGQTIIENFF